ncbi:hypothetical protein HXX76_005301 [Chlamydomonas incerta]|uniref:Uncharacterized protein n=1 Tax=Chlamydomonas incerta TaxID=51695 RepID=A0A835T4G4_CHLIN|nr:hypothetical protein HXX76_005301 [Chlamydomonas incerta]|eukprot:KAG2438757.1 hypothetical protein HXX76_005301 [Chlamydomonas incerta]
MAQSKLAEGLIIVAASYENDGCPIQALHCYQALVNQVLPPDVEVKARLNLARLMLEHTFNVKEACNHLLRAQSQSRSLIGCYCIKYEVADRLATAQQLLGDEAGELATYAAAAELWQSAQGSGEWAAVCVWACRLLQRQAAAHHRAGRPREAEAAAGQALAFAERAGGGAAAAQQRVTALLLQAQLALDRWDDAAADAAIKQLNGVLGAAAAAAAADSGGGGGGAGGGGGGGVLGPTGFLTALLHYNVLQVLYMLRAGKVVEVVKDDKPPQQPPLSPEEADAPGVPPPPQVANLDATWKQLAAAQSGASSSAAAAAAPYELPGMCLEPLVCLVAALALRPGGGRPRLTEAYLQRGLAAVEQLKRRAGLADGDGGGGGADEEGLAPQRLAPAGTALRLQLMLLQCRAQGLLARGELAAAREEVLRAQALCERHPRLLGPQLPAAHLLTGQYCAATGEHAAAAAHFQAARQHAPNHAAAAVASVLEAAAHLSMDDAMQAAAAAAAGPHHHPGQAAAAGPGPGLARAIEALGPFYAGAVAAPGSAPPRLGGLEDSAAALASAACLAQQGDLPAANTLLSKALRTAHRRLGHMQLVCGVLNDLALSFLSPQLLDSHSALEAARSATAFARAAGDLWAEARSKRAVAAVMQREGGAAAAAGNTVEADKSAAAAREAVEAAARREARVAESVAAAKADSGRHGYAAGWRLSAMVQG